MSWREQLVARLILLVARLVCDDPTIANELRTISTHVCVNAPKPTAEKPS